VFGHSLHYQPYLQLLSTPLLFQTVSQETIAAGFISYPLAVQRQNDPEALRSMSTRWHRLGCISFVVKVVRFVVKAVMCALKKS